MSAEALLLRDALAIAAAIRRGEASATAVVGAALARIGELDGGLGAFTKVTTERALGEARAVDRAIAEGRDPGPLGGVPYAVKNLFDVAGLTTLAGAKINAERPPAPRDAAAVTAMTAAGAVLVGATNMDEYAYGFTTENAHFGPTRNPHDRRRIAGGSSGGSAAAVAAGMVPLSLASDTNGSIRVPASLCGIFGLKPTYGRVSRRGADLFCPSFDHLGPFARSTRDTAAVFDVLHGPDPADPACSDRPREAVSPKLARGMEGLRVAVLDDYFARSVEPEAGLAVAKAAAVLGATRALTVPEAARARAAAFLITGVEGANLHLPDLKRRPEDFDPATRSRFLAGALVPATWYMQAQRFRRWFQAQMAALFTEADVLIAPCTPCSATLIGQESMLLEGARVAVRPNMGIFTQPISFIGLPVLAAPMWTDGELPIGVQLIGRPFGEADVLRAGSALEAACASRAVVAGAASGGRRPSP